MPMDYHERFFSPPMEEREFVYPEARQKLFINLVENYKIFCPDLSIVYAALNYNSELKIEYLIIFHIVKKEENGTDRALIMWDAPFLYSNRAIPAYRYAVKKNMHQQFFQECRNHLCMIPQERFLEFLQSYVGGELSIDPNNERFWKNPNMVDTLMHGMSEMSLQYRPVGYRNPNRPKEYF